MMHTRLFKYTFWVLAFVGAINYAAIHLYLYWTVWWFDMVVHFSAGVCVGMASVLVYAFYRKMTPSTAQAITTALIGALAIGVLWEFYELVFHITSLSDGMAYATDTSSDILMDLSGGLLGGLYAHHVLVKGN
jgi:hypothetical protein